MIFHVKSVPFEFGNNSLDGDGETGSASDCFDRNILGFAENELIQVMRLGLICTSEDPLRRPSMAEVVQVLESIRNGLESH